MDKPIKLESLHYVVFFSIILYIVNIFHIYRLDNTEMTTIKKLLHKIVFLLLVI